MSFVSLKTLELSCRLFLIKALLKFNVDFREKNATSIYIEVIFGIIVLYSQLFTNGINTFNYDRSSHGDRMPFC